jgi:hypothetical protein
MYGLDTSNKPVELDIQQWIAPQWIDRNAEYAVKKAARAQQILKMAPLIHQLVMAETAADEELIAELKAKLAPEQEYLLELSLVKPLTTLGAL